MTPENSRTKTAGGIRMNKPFTMEQFGYDPSIRPSQEWGTDGTEANTRARWRWEAAEYNRRCADNDWPADSCDKCSDVTRVLFTTKDGVAVVLGSAGCCQHDFHHIGSMCLHCGTDERGRGAWRTPRG